MPNLQNPEVVTRSQQYQRQVNYYDRWQRFFLRIGAFYDGFFGVLLYLAPVWTTVFFRLIKAPEGVADLWIRLDGIFLIIVALFYLLAARDPSRYLGIALICIVGKIWSVAFYSYYCFVLHAPLPFMIFAGLDFIFFFLHIWALGPDRKRRVMDAIKGVDLYP